MLSGHLYDPFRTALRPTIIDGDNLRKLIFLQSCCSIWSLSRVSGMFAGRIWLGRRYWEA